MVDSARYWLHHEKPQYVKETAEAMKLVFSMKPTGSNYSQIFTMNLRTGEVKQLTFDEINHFNPKFNSDKTKIVYGKEFEIIYEWGLKIRSGQVWLMSADRTADILLAENASCPAFAPTGEKIIYAKFSLWPWIPTKLCVLDLQTMEEIEILNRSMTTIADPIFNPTKTNEILFVEKGLIGGIEPDCNIYKININTSAIEEIEIPTFYAYELSYGWDGEKVALVGGGHHQRDNLNLWVYDFEKNESFELYNGTSTVSNPIFSLDNKKIYFFESNHIYAIDLTNNQVTFVY